MIDLQLCHHPFIGLQKPHDLVVAMASSELAGATTEARSASATWARRRLWHVHSRSGWSLARQSRNDAMTQKIKTPLDGQTDGSVSLGRKNLRGDR